MRSLSTLGLCVASVLAASAPAAHANGRAPLTNGIHFKPNDPHSMYVATTFGLLVSHDDGCTMNWLCEGNIGYGGTWDPKYAIAADGTIFATTYTGLRVSRDGGCSFTTATAELAPGTPNRIADIWIDALDVGPTGLVWVGTAESGQRNEVYLSSDDGVTFTGLGLMSATIFWKSIRTAPTNLARAYVSGYEVAPPTAHITRTDNMGGSWTPSPLANVVYGSTPILFVLAVDPLNADIVYMISAGAYNASGDRLYRSSDAGMTWTDVLDVDGPIKDVVITDAQTVVVSTLTQTATPYRSTDGGLTFTPIAPAPQLACLGKSPGGDLIGCGTNWQPDYEAVARSTDNASTFAKVWRFVELAGPLKCPAGTAEYDMCDQEMWDNLKGQFGATGPTCGANIVDAPSSGDPAPPKSGGCCDATPAPAGLVWLLLGSTWLLLRRRGR
jgi:uncharacterized protein (TIGR03382 family)